MTSVSAGPRQRGASLVEVLVAVFILAIGVLGAAALQLNALKYNQTAAMRSQATFLAYEVADMMRANRTAARDGAYDLGFDATPSGTSVPATDLQAWRNALAQRLPAGTGAIERDGTTFTIIVRWDESRLGAENDPDTDENEALVQFVFVTEL